MWEKWINIWSQFTLESFLRSNIDAIYAKVPEEDRPDLNVDTLAKLLPWSNDAVRGYAVFTYTPFLDNSFVQYLRDQLGHWWAENMHCLVGGMHSLADGFFSDGVLNEIDDLVEHAQAFKFSYFSVPWRPNDDFVQVSCYANSDQSSPAKTYTARVSLFNCKSFNFESIFHVFSLPKMALMFVYMYTHTKNVFSLLTIRLREVNFT